MRDHPNPTHYQRRKANTRRKLYDAAFELFKQQGYNAVSVDDITQHAGVARSSFFKHFERKAELLNVFRENLATEIEDTLAGSNLTAEAKLETFFSIQNENWQKHNSVLSSMVLDILSDLSQAKNMEPFLPELRRILTSILRQGQQEKLLQPNCEPTEAALAAQIAFNAMYLEQVISHPLNNKSILELDDSFPLHICLDGIAINGGNSPIIDDFCRRFDDQPESPASLANHYEQRRQKTRSRLFSAAIDLFEKEGVNATTVSDICTLAGTGRSTFFLHFQRKEEIIEAFAAEHIDALFVGDSIALNTLLMRFCALQEKFPNVFTAWMLMALTCSTEETTGQSATQYSKHLLHSFLTHYQQAGLLHSHLDCRWVSSILLLALAAHPRHQLVPGASSLLSIILNGCRL